MLTYKLYFLSADGHIVGAEPFECANDEEAMEQARADADGRASELWQQARKVIVFQSEAEPQRSDTDQISSRP